MTRVPIARGAAARAALALLLSALALSWPARADDSPRALVMSATERLMSALAVSGDEVRANAALAHRLASDTVLPLVDFDTIGKRVLGKHWRRATREQRAGYLRAFRPYAGNFLTAAMVNYSREIASHVDRVSFPPAHWSPGEDRAEVRMQVRLAGGAVADVSYRMRRRAQGWRVFDVTLEGISLVLVYRGTFAADIEKYGLDGLIERMREHNRSRPG